MQKDLLPGQTVWVDDRERDLTDAGEWLDYVDDCRHSISVTVKVTVREQVVDQRCPEH